MGNSYEKQLERIKKVTGCKTQYELADYFGVTQASVSNAHKKQVITANYFLRLYEKNFIHPEWIRTGHGPQTLIPASFEHALEIVLENKSRLLAKMSTGDLATELCRRAMAKESLS